MIKIIKTKTDYEKALDNIESLMDRNPKLGSPDANKLELLVLLVKDYETKNYPAEVPAPIDAILFRMEQQNLTQRDLIPYIGSRSKVSEVLSKKRTLTLSMIRALHSGLGIPVKALIQEGQSTEFDGATIDWSRFPIREMLKRRWIGNKIRDINNTAEDIIRNFLKPLGHFEDFVALYRKTENIRSARPIDTYSLMIWNARIMMHVKEKPPTVKYKKGCVNKHFMKQVALLSPSDDGPVSAHNFLRNHGIPLVIEPHLPRTHLDGAAFMTQNGPIIGLSLRHDRLDNFWFCLMHELAHLALHFDNDDFTFYDDLDTEISTDPREQEADRLASEVLIPDEKWSKSVARQLRTPEAAQHLANQLKIHPAIIAGKMRHFFKSYKILNQLVGYHKVRTLFQNASRR